LLEDVFFFRLLGQKQHRNIIFPTRERERERERGYHRFQNLQFLYNMFLSDLASRLVKSSYHAGRKVVAAGRTRVNWFSEEAALRSLLAEKERNEEWSNKFYSVVSSVGFHVPMTTTEGPDGFHYADFILPDPSDTETPTFTIDSLKAQLLNNDGYGVVVRSDKDSVDWVFSYGDIVQLYLFHTFAPIDRPVELRYGADKLEDGEELALSNPSNLYLPSQARKAMRSFLSRHGIDSPRVALMERKVGDAPVQELAFIGDGYSEEIRARLAWYVPRHYSIVHIPPVDKNFPSAKL
jgi:hypothetical protein